MQTFWRNILILSYRTCNYGRAKSFGHCGLAQPLNLQNNKRSWLADGILKVVLYTATYTALTDLLEGFLRTSIDHLSTRSILIHRSLLYLLRSTFWALHGHRGHNGYDSGSSWQFSTCHCLDGKRSIRNSHLLCLKESKHR